MEYRPYRGVPGGCDLRAAAGSKSRAVLPRDLCCRAGSEAQYRLGQILGTNAGGIKVIRYGMTRKTGGWLEKVVTGPASSVS